MLPKTGLLVVSNPTQIGKILSSVEKYVKKTLYIQLLSALSDSVGSGFYPNVFTSWPKYSQTIHNIYCQAANYCQNLDVRVLLSGIKYSHLQTKTNRPIDLVIFDSVYPQNEIDKFVRSRISNIASDHTVLTLDAGALKTVSCNEVANDVVCNHSVVGGTFDRIHIAHKLLLSEAVLRSKSRVTVGVTEDNMLKTKLLWELIEETVVRIKHVEDFLSDICPELIMNVVPISDPFGPSIVDASMDLIVVSSETIRGGEKINEIRQTKGLSKLEIVALDLVDEPFRQSIEEAKISSSTSRIRLLGTYLNLPKANDGIPNKPYVIGLTGGIASGKSGVAKRLSELGVLIIDCDKVAHKCYEPGKSCYKILVEHFGKSIVADSGEINRKILGSIVFKDPNEMKKLNSIVWPAIAEDVTTIIRQSSQDVIVIEAAVLLTAGWGSLCHEIWTTIVPQEEAVRRLKLRNGLTEEQAVDRITSQPSNTVYVKSSNVVFCTLWEYEYTQLQVDKAWESLQKRLKNEQTE